MTAPEPPLLKNHVITRYRNGRCYDDPQVSQRSRYPLCDHARHIASGAGAQTGNFAGPAAPLDPRI